MKKVKETKTWVNGLRVLVCVTIICPVCTGRKLRVPCNSDYWCGTPNLGSGSTRHRTQALLNIKCHIKNKIKNRMEKYFFPCLSPNLSMHCFSPIILKISGFEAFKITFQFHIGQGLRCVHMLCFNLLCSAPVIGFLAFLLLYTQKVFKRHW